MSFRAELEKKRAITIMLLDEAFHLLCRYKNIGTLIAEYHEYYDHNELELALNMLEEMALSAEDPKLEVWLKLKEVAESMGLNEMTLFYEQKISEF